MALFFVLVFISACDSKPQSQKSIIQDQTMGTYYRVTVVYDNNHDFSQQSLKQDIESQLKAVNDAMSTYLENSEISQFNRQTSTNWFEISEPFYQVMNASQYYSERTQGAFDVTVGPLIERWGFGLEENKASVIPSAIEIEDLLAYVGHHYIKLSEDGHAIKKEHPKTQINLSAIAKGYAVDKLAQTLNEKGFEHYLVDIGGEMRAKGQNQQGIDWVIGIEKPVTEERTSIVKVTLSNLAMATSGDYRNFYEQDNKRFSHTINPNTGLANIHQLASVTVIDNKTMNADAIATALMVMGDVKAWEYAIDNNIPAILMIRDNDNNNEESFQIKNSPEMVQYLVK